MADSFDNTTWLVTGASSGIGGAVADELARRGARLILTGRNRDRLDGATERARALGTPSEPTVLAADLAEPEAGRHLAEAALSAGDGVIDGLVNGAGYSTSRATIELTPDDMRGQIAVNVSATLALTRLLGPGMVERGRGWILNIGSLAGLNGVPDQATYAGTKAWVDHFSSALHHELRRQGVRVCALLPGLTRTRFFESAGIDTGRRFARLGSWSEPEHVARVGLDAVARGRMTAVPGIANKVLHLAHRYAPRPITAGITRWLTAR